MPGALEYQSHIDRGRLTDLYEKNLRTVEISGYIYRQLKGLYKSGIKRQVTRSISRQIKMNPEWTPMSYHFN